MVNLDWETFKRSAHNQTWKLNVRRLISYIPDWILVLIFTILTNEIDARPGFRREFSLQDISIQHTFADHERVPDHLLNLVALYIPAIAMPVVNIIFLRSFWDFHHSWLGLALSWTLTDFLTTLIKINVGRPRPDLISRCLPIAGSHDQPGWGLSNDSICTQTNDRILRDGFRSFPSGHSSRGWAGLWFLTLYLAGKLQVWDGKGYTAKTWLVVIPPLAATLIAVTRTMDYRHHWEDVLAGSLLGLTVSWLSYRQFFPTISHPESLIPLSRFRDPIHINEGEERERLFVDEEAGLAENS